MAEQLALLADPRDPNGLDYAADLISSGVERELIARIASLPLQPFQFGQYEGKRRVAYFWHSSGIKTSVIGALKRGLAPLQRELGIYVCGGRAAIRRAPETDITW